MGNLLSSLVTVAQSMRTVQQAMDASTNNVVNSQTPGFVKNQLGLFAKRFELSAGLPGGVEAGPLVSARKEYLERGVWNLSSQQGRFAERGSAAQQLEPLFDITQGAGIAAAIDNLFTSFSQWSINPNDAPLRQTVLEKAGAFATSFNNLATAVGSVTGNLENETGSVVDKINHLGQSIQAYNRDVRQDSRRLQDPGLDAQIHKDLEDLSEYVDFTTIRSGDGSYTVLLGGQTTLTQDDSFQPIRADFSSKTATIRDAQGTDVTARIGGGKLKGLLDVHNDFIPQVSANLDQLAETIAERVNATLSSGLDKSGNPPTTDLFRFDPTVGVALTLSVNNLTPDQLAGASAGAAGGNGNALTLAALGTTKELNDFTFTQFYGEIAGKVGGELATAHDQEATHSSLLSQARNVRQQQTSVSLDEEAANLVQFQRQYQANAELVRVLNSLTETMIGLLH